MKKTVRACLKATVYMYLPKKEDFKSAKSMSYFAKAQVGRVQLYDRFGERTAGKMIAFDNYGQLIDALAKHFKKLSKENKK